jgi:HD-GYP domain-containing protein (c-di-GMP phosphodiesterase class II)
VESQRQRYVQAVVLLSFTIAAGGILTAYRMDHAVEGREWIAAGMVLPLIVACRLFPLHIGYKRKMLMDSAPLFAVAILLPVWLAATVAGAGMAIAELSGRGPGYRDGKQVVFNASQRLLGALTGSVVFHSITVAPLMSPDLTTLLAGLAAALAMFFAQDLLLMVVVTAQLGRSVLADWYRDRGDVAYDFALYVSGFGVAFAASFHLWLLPLIVFPVAVFHRAMRDRVTLRSQTRDAVEALADVVDMRDPYTWEHSKRVALYSREICAHMGLSQDVSTEIVAAARVHDVGKIGVRDAVLLKAGSLEDAEFDEIKQHPDIGARLTARFPDFGQGTAYVRHHHEKWDGSGYPLGLKGQEIPLGARIIAVADTYDAMTSNRVYRDALSENAVRAEMSRVAGHQLDPEVVAAFFRYKGWVSAPVGERSAVHQESPALAG